MSLTAVYQQELKRTRQAVANQVRLHWNNLPDYRDDQVDPFVARVVPIVEAGQRRAISLTDAYLSHVLGTKPLGLDLSQLTGASVRNGVDPYTVYARPFTTVWTSIETIGFAAAVIKGLNRLTSTAEMDVALSARDASRAYAGQSSRIVGWVRVADPGCCDFCQMIDGARVGSEDASPLHNNCGCTLEPIEVGSDVSTDDFVSFAPGSVFDDVEIQEHGELGPVITNKHDNFTGPQDLQ
jgi:hypothetical protein